MNREKYSVQGFIYMLAFGVQWGQSRFVNNNLSVVHVVLLPQWIQENINSHLDIIWFELFLSFPSFLCNKQLFHSFQCCLFNTEQIPKAIKFVYQVNIASLQKCLPVIFHDMQTVLQSQSSEIYEGNNIFIAKECIFYLQRLVCRQIQGIIL